MAVIRRHWKLALFNALLLIAVVGGALTYYLLSERPAMAAAQPVERLSLAAYGRIETVRNAVALSAVDLASAGCSGAQAETVFASLKTWCDTNAGRLEQAEQAQRTAEGQLAEAVRTINVGPRDEMLLARYPALKSSAVEATGGVKRLHDEAFAAVTASLSSTQQQVLRTAIANKGVPDQLRYVPGLTDEQRQAARVAAARRQPVVDASRQGTIAAIRTNHLQNIESVLSAQERLLPVPAELVAESAPDSLESTEPMMPAQP